MSSAYGTGGDVLALSVRQGLSCARPVVILVATFDGIAGLRRSLERLNVRVALYFGVEIDAVLRRVARFWWADVMEHDDVTTLTRDTLRRLVQSGRELGALACVLGGGFPCPDVSLLNATRQGSEASRTVL